MARIFERWGALISNACRYSSVPPEFLAALIANESGGNPEARRFEPNVYRHLSAVRDGPETHYGGLRAEHLRSLVDEDLRNYSTSWGLTQILGYHVALRPGGIGILRDPGSHLKFALGLLAGFAVEFQLSLRLDFAELFTCWNTGRPGGKTFDPGYVAKGLERAKAYKAVEKSKV
jgi:hypothetical protein